jgi:hypothetical protein
VYVLLKADERKRALTLLGQMSSMNEAEEEIINNLIKNVVENGQSGIIYEALKENDYNLFYDLVKWNKWFAGMDNSDFDEFVQNVSKIVVANTTENYQSFCSTQTLSVPGAMPSSTRCFSFTHESSQYANNDYSYTDAYNSAGVISIKQKIKNGNGDDVLMSYFEGSPFDMVRFTFPENNSIGIGEMKGGEQFFAPAFYGAWIAKRYTQKTNLTALRGIVDGVVVLSAVASGGAASPLLVVDAAFAGADLVITMAEDKLRQSSEGQLFLTAWDGVSLVAGVTAIPALGGKVLTNGIYSFILKSEKIVDNIKTAAVSTRVRLVEEFNDMSEALAVYVSKLNKLSVSNILKSNLIYKLGEIKLLAKSKDVLQNWGLKIRNNVIAVAFTANSEYEFANLAFRGGTDVLDLKAGVFVENVAVTGEHVATLENVRYCEPGSYNAKTGDLELMNVTENGVTKLVARRVGIEPTVSIDVANATEGELSQIFQNLQNSPPFKYAPNTLEHKAERWAQYKVRLGNNAIDYSAWSNLYNSNMTKATRAHQAADGVMASIGWGKREVTVQAGSYTRRMDIADVGLKKGVEVKSYETGKVYATQAIKSELNADKYLIDNSFWQIEWVFKECVPSAPLKTLLEDAGITVTLIP